MKKHQNLGVEWTTEPDYKTGIAVTKLCDYAGHFHHLYFTNPGWYCGGRKLVVIGDRQNATNLFGIDLQSGEITQLTEFADRPKEGLFGSCVNPVRNEICFWHGRVLRAMSLDTLEERELWTLPEGQNEGGLNVTADGKYVMTVTSEDMSRLNLEFMKGYGYLGWEKYCAAKPLCQIVRVPADGGKAEILHAGNVWMGHMNTSPKHATHLTFCHEGPWELVDNRIWAMDTATGKIRPLRERRFPGERIGHEYWYADGERIGYHSLFQESKVIGNVSFDGSAVNEYEFNGLTHHIHSRDENLIVGDGERDGYVQLWRRNAAGVYDPARVLCCHHGSMHIQQSHIHPCFSPDGQYVLFTSDKTGYAAPYIARLPADLSTLPFA